MAYRDLVQVYKDETSGGGGTPSDSTAWPTTISPTQDAVECAGLVLNDWNGGSPVQDQLVKVHRTGGNLVLTDPNAGSKTLSQLSASASSIFVQSAMADLASDVSTNSTSFVDLLSLDISTVGSSFLLISVSAGLTDSNNNIQVYLRLVVDDIVKRGVVSRTSGTGIAESFAIVYRQPVTTGTHTVKVQWRVSANTGRCRPATQPDSEHCTIVVEEVLA